MVVLNTGLTRGFNYLYGKELDIAKRVKRTCEGVLEQAQFAEILTPTVVEYSIVVGETDRPVAASDAAIVFGFQTSDGQEQLALSYENTVPVCIFYLEHFADSPPWIERRFYYHSSHFRNENATSAHRLRQFHQVGYEILAGKSTDTLPLAIEVGSTLLTTLGLKHSIRISDVTVLSSVFQKLGLGTEERRKLRSLYDSGDTAEFEGFLARSPLDTRGKALLTRLFHSRCSTLQEIDELKDVLRANELVGDVVTRIECVSAVLSRLAPSARQCAAMDLSLVRTARLYTGVIWQYYFEGSTHECGGGGEYNRLMKSLGGPNITACGAAFGLERIINEYCATGKNPPSPGEILGETPGY